MISSYLLNIFANTLSSSSQQKFKKLIESTKKYALVNGKVVDLEDPDSGGDGSTAPSTPAPKKGRGAKAAGTPRSGATSGRKRKTKKDDDEEDSAAEEGTPVKKKRTTAERGAAKKANARVKEEAADEDDADEDGSGKDKETNGGADESAEANGDGDGDGDGSDMESGN